jgi:lipopolysaccharide export system protein LptA
MMIAVLSLGLFTGFAQAQSMDLLGGGAGSNAPITIDAKGGISWNQKEQVFIAAGPAKATRGDMVLDSDELRAYYRPTASGSSEAYRLDAVGHVRITSPGRVATGGHAVYDVDKAVIVLKDGHPVTLTAGQDVITTTGQLEFWDQRDLAVARGEALAIRADKRISANVLTAHFVTNKAGKNEIGRLEAFDNVVITTKTEKVYSDRAAYNVPTGLARLTGSVKIKRGNNVINGCSADIDLNTGVSRLNSCQGGSVSGSGSAPGTTTTKGPRVHGVLEPINKNANKNAK